MILIDTVQAVRIVCISRDGGIETKMLASASFQNRWRKKKKKIKSYIQDYRAREHAERKRKFLMVEKKSSWYSFQETIAHFI